MIKDFSSFERWDEFIPNHLLIFMKGTPLPFIIRWVFQCFGRAQRGTVYMSIVKNARISRSDQVPCWAKTNGKV